MKTEIVLQRSERTFQVWEYQVSHQRLLIRSPRKPAAEERPELTTNLDISCWGVEYMAIPKLFRGLELDSPTSSEIQHLEMLLGRTIPAKRILILSSQGKRFSLVAESFSFFENDWDIFDSPIEFRSGFRSE